MSDDLKPCPFCGSKDVYVVSERGYVVCCADCEAEGPYSQNEDKAIQKWNLAFRTKPVESKDF